MNNFVDLNEFGISDVITINNLQAFWKRDFTNNDSNKFYRLYFKYKNETCDFILFQDKEKRDKCYDFLLQTVKKQDKTVAINDTQYTNVTQTNTQKTNIMNKLTDDLKEFVHENRSTFYWIAAIFLIDYFFLNGALRSKLKDTVENMLNKINKNQLTEKS